MRPLQLEQAIVASWRERGLAQGYRFSARMQCDRVQDDGFAIGASWQSRMQVALATLASWGWVDQRPETKSASYEIAIDIEEVAREASDFVADLIRKRCLLNGEASVQAEAGRLAAMLARATPGRYERDRIERLVLKATQAVTVRPAIVPLGILEEVIERFGCETGDPTSLLELDRAMIGAIVDANQAAIEETVAPYLFGWVSPFRAAAMCGAVR